ncbi:hypothetical protein [Lentzea sp.]|uniref:hypothetical protein n=1 Tax=Lentzea sp. TaxID=56099 RepID=UPI002ED06E94
MIENSAAGLVMVPGEVPVPVTGEEHHQLTLARYGAPSGVTRQVAVHLTWCAISSGQYRGHRGVEVRLDGQRVGELAFPLSQRYSPLLMQVESGGGSTGCTASVRRGANGVLQVELRLPREVRRGAVVPVAGSQSWVTPVAIGAASVSAFFLVMAIVSAVVGNNAPEVDEAAALTSTAASTTTTTVEAPTSTTTSTLAPVPATTTAAKTTTVASPVVSKPQPDPQPQPQPSSSPQPTPDPQLAQQPSCHASYSPCVPITSDVDCEGGTEDGPAYVTGPVRVLGPDVYELDDNGDGVGCEKG